MPKDAVKAAEYYARAEQIGGHTLKNLKNLQRQRATANALAEKQAAKDMASVANPAVGKEVRGLLTQLYKFGNVVGEEANAAALVSQATPIAEAEVARLATITLSRQVYQKTDTHYSMLVGIQQRADKNVAPLNKAWVETASGLKAIEKSNAAVAAAAAGPAAAAAAVVVWEAGSGGGGGAGEGAGTFDASMVLGMMDGDAAKALLQAAMDHETAKAEPSPSAQSGMFFVHEEEDDAGRLDGYAVVVADEGKAERLPLAMNPNSGLWFVGGSHQIKDVAPFALVETVVQKMMQMEHFAGEMKLTTPMPAMRGWTATPPRHGASQVTAAPPGAAAAAAAAAGAGADGPPTKKERAKKAKGGGAKTAKKKVKVSTARMEEERTYVDRSMSQATYFIEPIRATMSVLSIIFNLAGSPGDLGFDLPAGFPDVAFAERDNLSGEAEVKKAAMRTGPLKSRDR